MSNCIFCKIVHGEIPTHKIYENEDTLAFLDINPIFKGHTLIITKQHFETLLDVPADKLDRLCYALQNVANAVMKATGADGFNILQNNFFCAGQTIPHVHFHIIPRRSGDGGWFLWRPKKADKSELDNLSRDIKNFVEE